MRSSPLSTIEKALKYWDYSKNTDNPSIVNITSSEKRYFICENGHSSLCQIRIFVQREKFYCRECQKTPLDIKLLQKNSITIKDNLTSVVHNKKYEWNCLKCSQKFNDRYRKLLQRLNNNKIMCPYCAEEKGYLKKGINDFQTQYPMLASLVVSHQPDSFMSSSSEKIQWTCNTNKNHIYFMSPKERIKKDLCKLCSYQESANQKRMRTAEDNKIPKAILNMVIDSEIPLTKLSAGSSKNWIEIEYPDCGHHRKTNPRNIVNFPQCSICSRGKPHSKSEKEILSFIQENIDPTIKIFANDRSVIAPQELDIYIPELKLAFEFNGLYWHSEKYKHKNYHADKWNNCRKNNVKLVSIWEDEWIYHQSTIKNIQQNDYRIKNTAIKEIVINNI